MRPSAPTGPPVGGTGGRTRFLPTLWRQIWIPLLCATVAAVGAYWVATREPPQYDATAFLRVGNPAVVKDALGIGEGTPVQNRLVVIPEEIHQQRIARRAAAQLRPRLRLTPAEVLATTKASIDGSRGLVAVSARADDRDEAARIANAMTRAYLDRGPRRDLRRVRRAREKLERLARALARTAPDDLRAASELTAVQERVARLRIIGAVRPQGITLAQAAGPPATPSGLPAKTIAMLAVVVGLMVGVVIVALRWSLRERRLAQPRGPDADFTHPVAPRGRGSGR